MAANKQLWSPFLAYPPDGSEIIAEHCVCFPVGFPFKATTKRGPTQKQIDPHGCGSKPRSYFGEGEFTNHFRTYFSGDWDVPWGCDLGFDPWPHGFVGVKNPTVDRRNPAPV